MCAENANPWPVFVELVSPDSGLTALPPFDKDTDVLLFFKLYDPKNKKIHYAGHHYMSVTAKVRECPFTLVFYILPADEVNVDHFFFIVCICRGTHSHSK